MNFIQEIRDKLETQLPISGQLTDLLVMLILSKGKCTSLSDVYYASIIPESLRKTPEVELPALSEKRNDLVHYLKVIHELSEG